MTARRSMLLASGLLVVASCGADPDAPGATAPPPAGGGSPIEAAFGTLTDPHELSEIYGRAYTNHAEDTQRCLAEAGFGDFVVEVWDIPTPAEFEVVRPAGAALSELGYGVGGTLRAQADNLGRLAGPADPDRNAEFLASLGESDTTVFFDELGACTEAAWERYPLPGSYPSEVAAEVEQVRTDALGSAEVTAAWDDWARCMADAGHRLATRADAVADVQEVAAPAWELLAELGATGPAPSPDRLDELDTLIAPVEDYERDLVELDVACAAEAEIERHITEAVTRYENDWLDANRDRVALVLQERPPTWWEE